MPGSSLNVITAPWIFFQYKDFHQMFCDFFTVSTYWGRGLGIIGNIGPQINNATSSSKSTAIFFLATKMLLKISGQKCCKAGFLKCILKHKIAARHSKISSLKDTSSPLKIGPKIKQKLLSNFHFELWQLSKSLKWSTGLLMLWQATIWQYAILVLRPRFLFLILSPWTDLLATNWW